MCGAVCAGSGADEAGVEGAGDGGVCGALDEGAAVREDCDGVGRAVEAEEEIVGAEILDLGGGDDGVAAEPGLQLGEVDGAVVLVDLDGVPAAEGDVGAGGTGEMGKHALAADWTVGTGLSG